MPDPIVSLNEESLRADLRELVRGAVEEMPDGLLDEEADDLVGAERHERTADREAHRAGRYERRPATTPGEATIRMPEPEGVRLTTAIIERRRRRETSVGEATIETCLAGVSTSRIEDAGEILWGSSVSAATVPNLSERALASVEERRNGPLGHACPHACVDGTHPKRAWGGSHEDVAAMVAVGVSDDGCREAIGAAGGLTESAECRRELPSWLRSRGLRGARMLAGDRAAGMVGSIAEVLPGAACQRRAARFCRNVLARAPESRRPGVAAMLRAIRALGSREASEAKALEVAAELDGMRLKGAARAVGDGRAETLTHTRLPREHWRRMRTDNAVERLSREIRRRTRVVGTLPDGRGALMLVTARLECVAESEWGSRRYPDVTLLEG